jgi:cytochrome P450
MPETKQPPSPPGNFLLGHLPELKRDALGLFTRCARECGDVVRLRFGLEPVLVLFHPAHIDAVLHSQQFVKHQGLQMNRLLLGHGLLSSEGEFWTRQRRLMQPAFTRERVASYGAGMVEATRHRLELWQHGQLRDIAADMRQLTMNIAARTLLGAEVEGQGPVVYDALKALLDASNNRVFRFFPLPEFFPTPANIRAFLAVQRLNLLLDRVIGAHRQDGREDDLLSLLLHARDEAGTQMTDQQLRDEAMTLLLAGHETTALALTWTLYLLARHPAVQDEVHAELREVLGIRDPGPADLPRLQFTEMVALEGMRLYPPAFMIARQAVAPCEVAGYPVKANQGVLMIQWVVHRDPRWYSEPERFLPARWADGLLQRLPRCAWFPFGDGPRVCLGDHFAMMELVLVLATILKRFKVHRVSNEPIALEPRMTLAPNGPVELVLEKRSTTGFIG